MRPFATLLHRLTAAVLLAWWVGGAVAAPLLACCAGGADPCCVAATAGHGCIGCEAPVIAPDLPRAHRASLAVPLPEWRVAAHASQAYQPWKPPD